MCDSKILGHFKSQINLSNAPLACVPKFLAILRKIYTLFTKKGEKRPLAFSAALDRGRDSDDMMAKVEAQFGARKIVAIKCGYSYKMARNSDENLTLKPMVLANGLGCDMQAFLPINLAGLPVM